MADDTVLNLTADVVTAHVSHNNVSADDLPQLIRSVFQTLSGLGLEPAAAVVEHVPAVSVRASVKPNLLTCLDCGVQMKMLQRHLLAAHGMSPDEYRGRWNLPTTYSMVAAEYSTRRSELAMRIGLGRKPKIANVPAERPKHGTRTKLTASLSDAEGPDSQE